MCKLVDLGLKVILLCAPALLMAQQATVEELERSCEESREAQLAPLREVEIEKCKAEKAMEPARCESYYKDYGNATRGAGGKYTERMFNDLPPCVKAREMQSKTGEGTVSTTKRGETTTEMDKTNKQLPTAPEEAAQGSQGKVKPISRDSTLGTEKRDTSKTESSPASIQGTENQVTEKAKSSRDSTLPDTKRDSASGTSSR